MHATATYSLQLYATLYYSLLLSITIYYSTITTAGGHGKQCWWGPYMPLLSTILYYSGGHGKQCWWGPCMPLLSTILYYSLPLSLPLLLLLLVAMASNAGGVHACHYYLLSTTLYKSILLFMLDYYLCLHIDTYVCISTLHRLRPVANGRFPR
jgi:hypothetical protein